MWIEYKKTRKHIHDFEIEYKLYNDITQKFFQGLRIDFKYADEEKNICDGFSTIYMIHPEFLDKDGNVIMDESVEVEPTGKAYMWIVMPEMRNIHMDKLEVGTKGHFTCGRKTYGDIIVTKIVGLYENPKTNKEYQKNWEEK